MKLYPHFLLAGILLSFSAIGQIVENLGLPFITYYSAQDYGAGIQNRTIQQDERGILYFANNFGLLEYDGIYWRNYPLPGETKVRDISYSSSGKIYVASQGEFGYFMANEFDQLKYHSLSDKLPERYRYFDETWRVFIINEQVIFCTFNQLFIYKNEELVKVVSFDFEAVDFYHVKDRLYITNSKSGLHLLEDSIVVKCDLGHDFNNKLVTGIIPNNNNRLFFTTRQNGIYSFDGKTCKPWDVPVNEVFNNLLINTCYRLKSGNIAIGTQTDGIYLITPWGKLLHHISKNEGLSNRTVLSFHEDLLGNLWVSHNNGLSLLELELPFSTIDEFSGLPGTGYDGIIHKDKLYLGTNNGLYVRHLLNDKVSFKLIEQTEGQVYSLEEIDGELFMGHHRGTFLVEGSTAKLLSNDLGAWTFLKLNNEPKIVVGTYNGLVLLSKDNGSWVRKNKIIGLEESSRVMELDADGTIWMTHGYKGVYKIRLNKTYDSLTYQFYNDNNGFNSSILINAWKINNRIVFSSRDHVYRYDHSFDRFVIDEFFSQNIGSDSEISYLDQDALGNIYFISENEIGMLRKQTQNTYKKETLIFNRLRSLLNDDLQKLKILSLNYILYATKNGFVLFNKEKRYNYDVPFYAVIRKVTTSGAKEDVISYGYNAGNDLAYVEPELSYKNNSISFEFSAPFYLTDHNMKFQYWLKGLSKGWSEWTDKNDKDYTNLREGNYQFYVRAKNSYEMLSETAVFSFYIHPPWYRSVWAYVIYLIGIAISLGLIYFVLDKKHKQEKRIITHAKEIEINKKESALKHREKQIQQLKNEKLESEIEIKNKELATSTMHILNKNSFINSIKNNISQVIKRSKNQEVKKELNRIMINIEKNIAGDDEWDQFSMHFDQVHGGFSKRIKTDFPDLTPQEMKLSAYLRMNLSTKEIAHLLNISVRGVEIARYRLRKKLHLTRQNNLQEFILKY